MLKGLEKLLLVGGIAFSSLIFSCSDDEKNPVEPLKPTPTQENRPPVISSSPITSISEKDYYGYSIKATDPDGDALTYTLTKGLPWLTVYNYGHVNGPPQKLRVIKLQKSK